MTDDFYKKALFAARVERDGLRQRRRELAQEQIQIELRLSQLDQTIEGLIPLSGEAPEPKAKSIAGQFEGLGLADACRKVLATQDRFMSPIRVRGMLQDGGYDLDKHSNPLAAIHSIMKRLVESGEAEALEVNNATGYRLKANISDAAIQEIKKRTAAATKKIVKEEIEKDKARETE